MYHVEFKDGLHITIKGVEDVEVNSMSNSDVFINNIISKMDTSETEFLRFCNLINLRLGVEVL